MKNTRVVTDITFKKISLVEEKQTQQTSPQTSQSSGSEKTAEKPTRLDPTRYGDWEKNGRCIDF